MKLVLDWRERLYLIKDIYTGVSYVLDQERDNTVQGLLEQQEIDIIVYYGPLSPLIHN